MSTIIERCQDIKKVILSCNFNASYARIEQSLLQIKGDKIKDIVDAAKLIVWDYVREVKKCKHIPDLKRLVNKVEMFGYDVNDINYLLFDSNSDELKQLEKGIETLVIELQKSIEQVESGVIRL